MLYRVLFSASRSTSWCLICEIVFWIIQTIQAFSNAQEKIKEFIFRILVNRILQSLRCIAVQACSVTRYIIMSKLYVNNLCTSWLKRPFFIFSHKTHKKKTNTSCFFFFPLSHFPPTITSTSTACALGVGRWGIVEKVSFNFLKIKFKF